MVRTVKCFARNRFREVFTMVSSSIRHRARHQHTLYASFVQTGDASTTTPAAELQRANSVRSEDFDAADLSSLRGKRTLLRALGFNEALVEQALQAYSSLDDAIDWLTTSDRTGMMVGIPPSFAHCCRCLICRATVPHFIRPADASEASAQLPDAELKKIQQMHVSWLSGVAMALAPNPHLPLSHQAIAPQHLKWHHCRTLCLWTRKPMAPAMLSKFDVS